MSDSVDEQITEMRKMGWVSSSTWQAYTWKNELAEQKRRISMHLDEVLADSVTEHDSHHMLERAIGVASVCMRRLIECRLVTDKFRDSQLEVHEIHAKANVEWREPFPSKTAESIFNNYDLTARDRERRSPKFIADKMLHARVIGVLSESVYLPDGILISSDTQRKTRLFHFTPVEFAGLFDVFLNDRVTRSSEGYIDADGNFHGTHRVFSTRE
ncbi:hypothetical protein [Chromohalobacter japonicus]|uniref:hypothetical protein n=1 Tax=Chromohalobacter japonicus TaxID=223900 RepID=UPI001FF60819|nr:hypothetical protein [Chromohalobacter japonicus]MCK0754341.1 hypothetical protein [Chromohalobacter japonicus]